MESLKFFFIFQIYVLYYLKFQARNIYCTILIIGTLKGKLFSNHQIDWLWQNSEISWIFSIFLVGNCWCQAKSEFMF